MLVPRPALLRLATPLALAWLGACNPSSRDPAPDPVARTGTDPTTKTAEPTEPTMPATPWADPPRTHVLLMRHEDGPALDVLPLQLPPTGAPVPGVAHHVPAPTHPDGHFSAAAAHGGQSAWAHAGGREGAYTVIGRDVDPASAPVEVPIGATIPAAMHMVGRVVIVGAGNTLGTVDLAAAQPRWQPLHQRPEMRWKAYDLFARAGDWLVAIDDVVMPIYADTFTLDAKGHPTHRAAWELPGVINGRYHAAVLGRTGAADGTLWAVASYGIMDGHGQDLAALAIENDALRAGPDVTLNSHVMTDPPVLEEHVSRQTGKPETLAFGSDYSPWTGLAHLPAGPGPARLLLAAGPRGLLVLPERFEPTTRADAIDVQGECADVLVLGSRVLALVAGPAPALLELRPTDAGLEPGPRTALPAAYERFVR